MARPLQWSRRAAFGIVLTAAMVIGQLSTAYAQGISLIRDAEIERFVREIANPIFETAGLEPQNVELLFVNDASLNAFVAGGQNMFFHTGLLQRVDNTSQLAGVIAHETGHIAGGHLARLPDAFKTARVAMILSTILGAAALAAGAGDAGIAILQGGQHVAQRSILAYSRGQESAADQAGLRYLEGIGWSAQGFAEFMGILAEQEVLSARRQDPYVRTHPLTTERVATIQAGARQSPYYHATKAAAFDKRLALIQAKLSGFLDKPMTVLRKYPETDTSQEGHYARAVAFHRVAQIDQAVKELDALISKDPDNPYYHELLGQILFESGKVVEAVEPHRRSVELAPNEPLFQINLARALVAVQSDEADAEAKEILLSAIRIERDLPIAWHQLAIVYHNEGNEGMASLASAERYTLLGSAPNAFTHATRAHKTLPKGSPGWIRAGDILAQVRNFQESRR